MCLRLGLGLSSKAADHLEGETPSIQHQALIEQTASVDDGHCIQFILILSAHPEAPYRSSAT